MKYILTETESFAEDWNHKETFGTLCEAQTRMKNCYHDIAVEGEDAVEKAELYERSAVVKLKDGNEISWDIATEPELTFIDRDELEDVLMDYYDFSNMSDLDWEKADKEIEKLCDKRGIEADGEAYWKVCDGVIGRMLAEKQ